MVTTVHDYFGTSIKEKLKRHKISQFSPVLSRISKIAFRPYEDFHEIIVHLQIWQENALISKSISSVMVK